MLEFLLAVQFLSMIPIHIRGKVEEINLARSMAYFPFVGALIGIITAGFYALLTLILPTPVCILFAMTFVVMITGNMHLDGLMDTADGIFSGRPREKVLEIMKDSRVGSHGVAAGVLALLIRFVLLSELAGDVIIIALITVPVLGRWAQVYGAVLYPYARVNGGTGRFTDRVGARELIWASFTVLAVLFITNLITFNLVPITKILTIIGGSVIGTALGAFYISRKLGGLTGDTYGALTEIAEIAALLMLLLV